MVTTAKPAASISRNQLLAELLESEDADICWVFKELIALRPSTINGLLSGPLECESKGSSTMLSRSATSLGSKSLASLSSNHLNTTLYDLGVQIEDSPSVETQKGEIGGKTLPAKGCTIQFSSKIYFCDERRDEKVELTVVRSGDSSSNAQVNYSTADMSAKAETNYLASEGTLCFCPGQHVCKLTVPLMRSTRWEQTKGFQVNLQTEGLQGAHLGRHLSTAAVFIVDEEKFPSDRCKAILDQNIQLDDASVGQKLFLLKEWFFYAVSEAKLWPRVFKSFLLDQLHNLCSLVNLLVGVVLVDMVLKKEPTGEKNGNNGLLAFIHETHGNRRLALAAVSLISVMFVPLLHFLDIRRISAWRITSPMTILLQSALLRHFFHVSMEVRSSFNDGQMIGAIMTEAPHITEVGTKSTMALGKHFGRILVVVIFNIISVSALGSTISIEVLMAALLWYVLVIPCIFFCLGNKLEQCARLNEVTHSSLLDKVTEIVTKHQLILDCFRRTDYCKVVEKHAQDYFRAKNSHSVTSMHKSYAMRWTSVVLNASYMMAGGLSVISGSLTLGMFLATLKILRILGKALGDALDVVVDIRSTLPLLTRVITLMNLTSDYGEVAALTSFRQKRTAELLPLHQSLDNIPIQIDMAGAYIRQSGTRSSELNFAGKLQLSQGRLICVFGGHRSGKTTLVKLFGAQLLQGAQDVDKVFVPAHLRTMHVPCEPLLLNESLINNLLLGASHEEDKSLERVLSICRRLGLAKDILGMIKSEEVHDWDAVLSIAEKHLLGIARALIANMELLVCHKPLANLSPECGHGVLTLLKEFIAARGVEQDSQTTHLRRFRTCIVSSVNQDCIQACDQCIWVSESGVKNVDSLSLLRSVDAMVQSSSLTKLPTQTSFAVDDANVKECDLTDLPGLVAMNSTVN
eukprot:TRINITY_DN104521_c0_g1_i1.p1 TRINITY_DN104521_c0_g1~~TRINITY_DN104521_c0_g1_i1.p1  ORF type:complete len:929 (+),score=123.47 TRINITY_DN104521_c0_g1_i1:45-2789(+)